MEKTFHKKCFFKKNGMFKKYAMKCLKKIIHDARRGRHDEKFKFLKMCFKYFTLIFF